MRLKQLKWFRANREFVFDKYYTLMIFYAYYVEIYIYYWNLSDTPVVNNIVLESILTFDFAFTFIQIYGKSVSIY